MRTAHLRKYADVLNVRLIVSERIPSVRVNSPADVVRYIAPAFLGSPVELFIVILLNANNGVLGHTVVSSGILNSSLVHPREVFQCAILAPAAGIILAHNHPSGNPEPSSEDIRITKQMVEAGKILGIPVHDHVIVCADGASTSFTERGLI